MENNKTRTVLTIAVLGLFLAVFSLWAVLKPADAASEAERRSLAQMPTLTGKTLLSGTFADRFEDYATDQFPLRDEYRTLKALTATGVLRQRDNNGLYRVGDTLGKLEYPMNTDSLDYAAKRFQYLYDTYLKDSGSRVYLSLVPDKNYFMAASNGYPSIDYDLFAEELQARSEELRSRTQRTTPHFGKRRMLRAFPKLKHGAQNRSLDTLREQLKRK